MNTVQTPPKKVRHIPTEQDNLEAMQNHMSQLRDNEAAIKNNNHHVKNAKHTTKLSPRERISGLLDANSHFFECSFFAGHELYDELVHSGGIITGVGFIHGKPCVIIANDYRVKGGCYFPITVKKHLRAQKIAQQFNIPCITLVDSGGAYLPMQSALFADANHFGRIFYNQANMSAMGIPQISIIMGACTAGGAYVPAMSDETIMVKNQASLFLAGPLLVEAATGEKTDKNTLGGAQMHATISGVVDHLADNDRHALEITRNIVKKLPTHSADLDAISNAQTASKKIYRYISSDARHTSDIRGIISCIVDANSSHEFKSSYGTTLCCITATIGGHAIGIIANNGVLMSTSALKGCHFIQLCNQRKIPLLFLQDISGFMVGQQAEQGGIAKHGAMMVNALATSTVPKITILTGKSYGAGNYAMCGRAFSPHFLWAWPNSCTAVMGGAQAAEVLYALKSGHTTDDTPESMLFQQNYCQQIHNQYQQESTALYTSARLFDDGIIDPKDSRFYILMALELLQHIHVKDNPHGIFRV